MSLFPYLLLPKGEPERPDPPWWNPPPGSDEARNINAEPEERTVQATLCELNGDGEVEYTRNVSLRVRAGVCLPLKAPPDAPNSEQYRLYGITAEPRDEPDLSLVKECALVAAAWPWSRRWHDYGYFKPPADKGAERASRIWQQALGYSGGWRGYLREEATVNLFSQQRGSWKAVLFDPNLAHENVAPGREYSLPRPKNGNKQQPDIVPSIHWGLCRGLAECTRALDSREHTPELDDMKEGLIEGWLFKKYHAGHPKLDPRDPGNAWTDHKTGRIVGHGMVHESLRNTARADEFMSHAIRIALAGPEDFDEFEPCPGKDGQPRRLARIQVKRIYLELVLNAHKRAVHAQHGGRQSPPPGREPAREAQQSDPKAAFDAAIEERVKFLGTQSDKARRRLLAEAMRILEMPGVVEWTPEGEDSVDPNSASHAMDVPAIRDAVLDIVALARLGITDAHSVMYLKEALDGADEGLRLVIEYALAELKSGRSAG